MNIKELKPINLYFTVGLSVLMSLTILVLLLFNNRDLTNGGVVILITSIFLLYIVYYEYLYSKILSLFFKGEFFEYKFLHNHKTYTLQIPYKNIKKIYIYEYKLFISFGIYKLYILLDKLTQDSSMSDFYERDESYPYDRRYYYKDSFSRFKNFDIISIDLLRLKALDEILELISLKTNNQDIENTRITFWESPIMLNLKGRSLVNE